ncbi:hypothetical protein C2U55_02830 [Enterobacteriaceae bacterium ENNIH3]|jgi:hypothetical protein|nr:hypothetical protein C2U55_02830 [Enterobacteriaceae bacterium ENNIH3]AUV06607.1 hypothetical protein C2U52_10120 [Enterobacteriaceae bacterium ENNIH2]PWF53271.1 hypothetical protein BHT19_0021135 [[Kluyvera] intestini]
MSEKCDLCHLKLAVFLSILQAFTVSSGRKKHGDASFTYRGDNGGENVKELKYCFREIITRGINII